ncbi:MAG: Methyltransferase type 12 [Candidatus Magasanikbacteria bacterium GW2011_GWC2_41_17]|uniref:Methyltransferase type 12 n=2 Tax=Candidatus Magasanikiibacteriota TaxID=1752731 RepID=A0A0G0WLK3_9BACT|nr:MAG: Methyltransferase type 12 [Candidatus Magasanikbacteria bacterium GW2011_GWC2_41_17]KKS13634.1 MAG: Methyltransferase type 12 [Candidatus Magasanikbacteria bacterium GW2011_GWA2_41_55]
MRDILAGYKIFNIDPYSLRSKDSFKHILEYRHYLMGLFRQAIKSPVDFKCLLCSSTNGRHYLSYQDYPLFECLACGLVSPNINLDLVNEEAVYDSPSAKEDVMEDVINNYEYRKRTYATERLRYLLEKISIPKKDIKLLDVGCGPGYFLEHLKDGGINYKGLELADFLVEICQNRGLNVARSELKEEPNNSYNVITLYDVLEHLRNPMEMFKTLNNKLLSGGYVLAYIPNIHSIATKLMEGRHKNVDPFVHLCFFDPKSLNFLAEKNGFQVESVDYYGLDIMDFLFMKTYDDGFDYLTGLKEFIPVMQAVLDKQKLSNHQRVVFKKI